MKPWFAVALCTSMALLASVHAHAVLPDGNSPGTFSPGPLQNLATGSTRSNGLNELLGGSAAPAEASGIAVAAEPGGEAPEPATFLLLGAAFVGIGVIRRRKGRARK